MASLPDGITAKITAVHDDSVTVTVSVEKPKRKPKPTRIRMRYHRDVHDMTRPDNPETLPKSFYALTWTWRKFRAYRTKGAAERGLAAWKRAQERAGWTVKGSVKTGYFAVSPAGSCLGAHIHAYKDGKRVS